MNKRLLGFMCAINVCGILLCVGLFFFNMAEMKRLSVQYKQLQENVQQFMNDKEVSVQDDRQNKSETSTVVFFSEQSEPETSIDIPASEDKSYGLVKSSYLVNEFIDDDTNTVPLN